MNPTSNPYQSLLITATSNRADVKLLLESAEDYMIGMKEALQVIQEVMESVRRWETHALRIGASKREMDLFRPVFDRQLKHFPTNH